MVSKARKKERGVAILAVLVGIALMTLIVVDFAMTSGLGFVSAANQANEMRAGYLARSGVNIGLALLAQAVRNNTQTNSPQVDTLNDAWAVAFPPMAVEGGNVSLSIVDEARKLPINAMVNQTGSANVQPGALNAAAIAKVQRLFTILDVNPDLVQGIIEWITPSGANGMGGGGEFYAGLRPPYQPRYGPMPTIGDLQMVQGFNEEIFNRVSPFLTVMTESAVNINTAPPQVIASLEPELMQDQKIVVEIVEERATRPFTKNTDLGNLPGIGEVGQRLQKDVAVSSHFFTINGRGTYAGARKIITATFQRQTTGVGTLAAWHED
jgi:general secretion pathway protein K